MIDPNIAEITARFTRWLARFSPPRHFANNHQAMQDDADASLRIILEYVPRENCLAWFDDVIYRLEAGMTTRAWPAPGEITKACRAALATRPKRTSSRKEDDPVIEMMIDWHRCKGSQMPGCGSPARTRELIRRGVLGNTADARYLGYAISYQEERELLADRARRRAAGERLAAIMEPAEYDRHVRIRAKLKGISEDEARADEESDALLPDPDLSSNFLREKLQGVA